MKRVKNVGAFIAFQIIGLIKLPFTLIVAIAMIIEHLLGMAMVRISKFGSEWFKSVVDDQLEKNAESYDDWAETMRDLKIES